MQGVSQVWAHTNTNYQLNHNIALDQTVRPNQLNIQ